MKRKCSKTPVTEENCYEGGGGLPPFPLRTKIRKNYPKNWFFPRLVFFLTLPYLWIYSDTLENPHWENKQMEPMQFGCFYPIKDDWKAVTKTENPARGHTISFYPSALWKYPEEKGQSNAIKHCEEKGETSIVTISTRASICWRWTWHLNFVSFPTVRPHSEHFPLKIIQPQ